MTKYLKLPAPRFQPGQYIRFTRYGQIQGFEIVARVQGVQVNGQWHGDGTRTTRQVRYQYTLVCQKGCRAANGRPILPGTVLVHDVDETDAVAIPVVASSPVCPPLTTALPQDQMQTA
jgi:hypothetical protein